MNKLLLFTAGLVLATSAFSQKGPQKAASTSKPRGNSGQAQKEAAQSNFQKPKYHSVVKGKNARKAKGG